MRRILESFLVGMVMVLFAACSNGAVTVSPTTTGPAVQTDTPAPAKPAAPTDTVAATGTVAPITQPASATAPAATQPATAPSVASGIAVQLTDNSVALLDASGKATTLAKLSGPIDLSSIFPPGNVLGGALYLPVSGQQATFVRVDAGGATELGWIKGPLYGLAVSPGRIAWGHGDLSATPPNATITVSGLDGANPKVVVNETYNGFPRVLRPIRWSQDGTRLYYGKEPVGLGGYILFAGFTNLWALDMNSGKSTELLHERAPNAAICLDDLAPNEKLVADHCSLKNMELIDLTTGKVLAVKPPVNMPAFAVVGGARFSPDSSRFAYGLARRDPENEQGWLAVTDGLTVTSHLIAQSPAKDYFAVSGWLDTNTIVLQSSGQKPGIWTVGADGSNLKRLGDGIFLGILSSNQTAQVCGDIRTLGPNPPQGGSALKAEDCFFQAYQQCRAATLTVTMAGVDAGTINRFEIQSNGNQCQIVDNIIHYVVPRATPAPVTATCQGLVRQNGGLLFKGCGDEGDILLPAP